MLRICTGSVGLPPGTVRRGLLVLLETMLPYLVDQIGTSAEGSSVRTAPWASHGSVADHSAAVGSRSASSGEFVPDFPCLPGYLGVHALIPSLYPGYRTSHTHAD